jgi:azurin
MRRMRVISPCPEFCRRKASPSLIQVNDRPTVGRYAGFIMKPHALLTIVLLGATVAACRGPEPTAPDQAAAPPAATAATAQPGRAVEITANDTMKFSTVEIHAKAGERLSVTLVNTGATPKFSMGHNWILLTPDANVDEFLTSAAEAPTTEYVPPVKKAQILAATKLLGPGERDTATFTAAATPGRYPFLCSYPGHAQVGMRGVLIVE